MKRFLCPKHAHLMKGKPIQLSTENCSACRWENRPWTLKDFAVELENISASMRFAHEDPYYDPHGITYARDFEEIVKTWVKSIHKDYRKNFIKSIQELENETK